MAVRGVKPNMICITPIVKGLAQNKQMPDAEELIKNLAQMSTTPDDVLVGTLVDGYAREGNIHDAQRWFFTLKKPTVIHWTQLLSAFAYSPKTAQNQEQARDTLKRMVEANVQPNPATLRVLEAALGRKETRALCDTLEVDFSSIESTRRTYDATIAQQFEFRQQHKQNDKWHSTQSTRKLLPSQRPPVANRLRDQKEQKDTSLLLCTTVSFLACDEFADNIEALRMYKLFSCSRC